MEDQCVMEDVENNINVIEDDSTMKNIRNVHNKVIGEVKKVMEGIQERLKLIGISIEVKENIYTGNARKEARSGESPFYCDKHNDKHTFTRKETEIGLVNCEYLYETIVNIFVNSTQLNLGQKVVANFMSCQLKVYSEGTF